MLGPKNLTLLYTIKYPLWQSRVVYIQSYWQTSTSVSSSAASSLWTILGASRGHCHDGVRDTCHTHRAQLSQADQPDERPWRFAKMVARFCMAYLCPEPLPSVAYQWVTLTRIFYTDKKNKRPFGATLAAPLQRTWCWQGGTG